MRGINLKMFYNLLSSLDNNNNLLASEKRQQRELIKNELARQLETNFLNGHIYLEDIEQIQTQDFIGHFKIIYYPTMSDKTQLMYINFLHDCVDINGLYIKY